VSGTPGLGGNGGGSIELGAIGSVVIGGTIDVHGMSGTGGDGGGGGGSAGTIVLLGNSVALVGSLIANGGNGGDSFNVTGTGGQGGGGGGGGGLILIATNPGHFLNDGTINVAGGLGGVDSVVPAGDGLDGGPGVISAPAAVPEPSSLALAIVGAAGLAMMARRGRRSQSRAA
jgi:hypothetical protein